MANFRDHPAFGSLSRKQQEFAGSVGAAASRIRETVSSVVERKGPVFQMASSSAAPSLATEKPVSIVPPVSEAFLRGGAEGTRMNLISAMESTASSKAVIRDIAAAGYESLISGGGISRGEAHGILQDIRESRTGIEAYQKAERAINLHKGKASVFTGRLNEAVGQGFYDLSRLEAIQAAAPITNEFAQSSPRRQVTSIIDLPDATSDRVIDYTRKLQSAAKEAGLEAGDWQIYEVEDTIGGKKVTTPMLTGKIGEGSFDEQGVRRISGTKIQIPLEETGWTYGGRNLTSVYQTQQSIDIEGGPHIPYGQHYTKEIENLLLTQKGTAAKDAVHAKNLELLGLMNERDTTARSTSQWTVPEMFMTAGQRVKARLIGQQVVTTRQPTQLEAEKILTETAAGGRQLFPFGAPSPVQKGTFATTNVRELLYGPTGRWTSPSRRAADQPFREWSATQRAKDIAPPYTGEFGRYWNRLEEKVQGPDYKKILYGKADPTSAAAYTAPSMVTVYAQEDKVLPKFAGVAAEEMGMISPEAFEMLEVEKVEPVKIVTEPGFMAAAEVKAMADVDIGKPVMFDTPIAPYKSGPVDLATGELIGLSEGKMVYPGVGVSEQTGKEIFAQEGERFIGAKRTGRHTMTLYKATARTPEGGKFGKHYSTGGSVKHTMHYASSQAAFEKALSAAGGAGVEQATGQRVHAVISEAILHKDARARYLQQIEAMSLFAAQRLKGPGVPQTMAASVARDFLENPERTLGVRTGITETQVAEQMVAKATQMGFTPEELQMSFAAMPEKIAENIFITDELAEMRATGLPPVGDPTLRLGEFADQYGRVRGSFDPATIHMLAMKGEAGHAAAMDISSRIIGAEELIPAERMMASMTGAADPTGTVIDEMKAKLGTVGGTPIEQFAGVTDDPQRILLGRKYEAFGGSSYLDIPGRTEMPEAFKMVHSSSGEMIPSELERGIMGFHKVATGKDVSVEAQERAAEHLRRKAQPVWAKRAAGGGKALGTGYLHAIRDANLPAGTIGVSPKDLSSMFDEVLELTQDEGQREFLREQRHRALGEKKPIAALMTRSPAISPEAAPYTWLVADKELSEGMVSFPEEFAKIQYGNSDPRVVDISKVIDMAEDFDGDHNVVSLIGNRDAHDRVVRELGHENAASRGEYLFQKHVLSGIVGERKVKEDISAMGLRENLIAGHRQLTATPQRAGLLNVSINKLKLALGAAAPEHFREIATALEVFEQSASMGGSKRGDAAAKTFSYLTEGVERKDPKLLEMAFETMFGTREVVAGSLDEQAHKFTKDPKKWANISISALKASEQEVEASMAVRRIAKNKQVSRNATDALAIYNMKRTSIDPAQIARHANAYGPAGLGGATSRTYQAASIGAKRVAESAKRLKNPVLAAAAVGAGMLLMAPAVAGTLAPSRNKEGPDGGRNQMDESYTVPGGYGMQPPPGRIMESPKAYQLPGRPMSAQSNLNFRVGDLEQSRRDIMRQANALGHGARVRVNIKDDRNRLDSSMLAQKIHERL